MHVLDQAATWVKESSSLNDVPASAQLTLMNWTKVSLYIFDIFAHSSMLRSDFFA